MAKIDQQIFDKAFEILERLQERRSRDATLTSDAVRRSFGIETVAAQDVASPPKHARIGRRTAGRDRDR